MMSFQSIREAFEQQDRVAARLHEDVMRHLATARSGWFTDSRVKRFESFEQKVESGRVSDPSHLEDFVAAMVVVPNVADIDDAVQFVSGFFDVAYRRPESPTITTKLASSFIFDDLRLFGTLRADSALPPRPIDQIVFEIQIKTFLQHAWSIATHDVVYKHDVVSWRRSRVAAMVKALLEQAELAIGNIDVLQNAESIPEIGEPESSTQEVIAAMIAQWDRDDLPRDLRRVADNLLRVGQGVSLDAAGVVAVLRSGAADHGGTHPDGWSPYDTFVDYLSVQQPTALRGLLSGLQDGATPFSVYVTPEVLRRLGLDKASAPRARL